MPYSVWQAFITDGESIVSAASVEVLKESDGSSAQLYDGPAGAAIDNPTTSDLDGLVRFYAAAGLYRINVTKGGITKTFRHVPIGTGAGIDADSKQDALVSGTNIKSINGTSLLGEGNLVVGLAGFAAALNEAYPNAVVPVASLTADDPDFVNIGVALVVKGNAGLMAQVPTADATGGDVRGQYATDWQRARTLSTQVAAGNYSTLGGGYGNTASGGYSVIAGGRGNGASNIDAVVAGGNGNTAFNTAAVVVGGSSNSAGGINSVVVGGTLNNAPASYGTVVGGSGNALNATNTDYSFIGGGSANAVNANSQYTIIVGGNTNIAEGNYAFLGGGVVNALVSAWGVLVGGYSNIVRGEASVGVGGYNNEINTGSDYTFLGGGKDNVAGGAHSFLGGGLGNSMSSYLGVIVGGESNSLTGTTGVIVGGFNHTIVGPYGTIVGGSGHSISGATTTHSFIGGGADHIIDGGAGYNTIPGGRSNQAGTGGYGYCTVGGGYGNTAVQDYATVAGGEGNDATGGSSFVGGGRDNTASGTGSVVPGGSNNTATGDYSTAMGNEATTRSLRGAIAHAAGVNNATGDCQNLSMVLRNKTTDATPTVLKADATGVAVSATNTYGLEVGQVALFDLKIIGRSGAECHTWHYSGTIHRAGAGAIALVGALTLLAEKNSAGAAAWSVAVTADAALYTLEVEVTGAAATNINWGASLNILEVL